MRGADLWPSRGERRRRLAVGCLMVVLILAGLAWAITSLPESWKARPRQLPTPPPPPLGFYSGESVPLGGYDQVRIDRTGASYALL